MKSLKIVIILLFILLIGLCVGGAYAYFATDLLKTPKQLFCGYLDTEYNKLLNFNTKPFDTILDAFNNDTIEMKVSVPDSKKPIVVATVDSEKNAASAKLEYTLEDADSPLEVEMLLSDNEFGLKLEEIYDKFIVVENRDLKNVLKLFGVEEEALEEVPDSYPKSEKVSGEYEETLKQLVNEYSEKFIEKFDAKQNFTSNRNVDVQINGETIKANKYSLVSTKNAFMKAYYEILKEFYSDSRFVNIYKEMYGQNDDMQKEMEELLNQIDFENEEDGPIEIALYVVGKEVKKTAIVIGETNLELMISNTAIEVNGKVVLDGDTKVIANTEFKLENTYNDLGGEITLYASTKYDKEEVETEEDDDNLYSAFSYTYDPYQDTSFKVNIKVNKNGTDYDMDILVAGDQNAKLEKVAEVTFSQGANVQVTKSTSSNSVVLNDFTKEDLANLEEELMKNFMTNIMTNPNSTLNKMISEYAGGLSNPGASYEIDTPYDDDLLDDNTSTTLTTEQIANKEKIEKEITNGINNCLTDFKMALLNNSQPDILTYLTMENIQKSCYGYKLELLQDGMTIKCTMEYDLSVYYAKMDLDMQNLTTNSVTVYTESEYNNL